MGKISMDTRKGGYLLTFTGIEFYPLDARVEDIHIKDIAHSLSMLCRFAGHSRHFYSVAQHSILVSEFVESELISREYTNKEETRLVTLAALLHDASEAYVVDLPTPIKRFMPDYQAAENALHKVIAQRFGFADLSQKHHDIIKEADEVLLSTEMRDLLSAQQKMPRQPLSLKVRPWKQEAVEPEFLRVYERLTK